MPYAQETMDFACKEERKIIGLINRLHTEAEKENREPLQRDYGRILYSSSFRRLQGKMQLLGINHAYFFRNRLTHSLEASQIAREVATQLRLEFPIVAESCALAHDLGNPPFGHYGEGVLDQLAQGIGGFEGNAQAFRILHHLEKRHYDYGGLNLTLRTLLGVIKYFKKYENGKNKKFIYDADFELILEQIKKFDLDNPLASIDMQIMDLADEIAYAAHDLEDCLSIGYFTVDELLHEFYYSDEYKDAHYQLQKIVQDCRDFASKAERLKTSEEYAFLFRRKLTSMIVHTLVRDIHFSKDANKLNLENFPLLSEGLKKLTFKAVLRKPSVQLYEKRGEKIIKGLYDVYTDEQYNKGLMLLSPEYRHFKDDCERRRNVIDFIAGMMDSYAMQEYEKYFGSSGTDRLYFKSDR